jgi:hypothetical protein
VHIHNVISFTIISIELPITFFNICDTWNNNSFHVVDISNGSIDKKTTIKLPDNFYTIDTLHKTVANSLKKNGIHDLKIKKSNNKTKFSSKEKDYIIDFTKDRHSLGCMLGFTKQPKIYIQKDNSQPIVYENDKNQTICNLFNPRYLFLEVIEYHHHQENKNEYLFTSSLFECQISKHIMSKNTIDYKNYPFGSLFPANLVNGFLASNNRIYKKHIKVETLRIRVLNEFGIPICLNGHEISFCCQFDCHNDN